MPLRGTIRRMKIGFPDFPDSGLSTRNLFLGQKTGA
jgi:hypothetical protein